MRTLSRADFGNRWSDSASTRSKSGMSPGTSPMMPLMNRWYWPRKMVLRSCLQFLWSATQARSRKPRSWRILSKIRITILHWEMGIVMLLPCPRSSRPSLPS